MSENHINVVSPTLSDGQAIELERTSSGVFRCPFCLGHEDRDARQVQVSPTPVLLPLRLDFVSKPHLSLCEAQKNATSSPAGSPAGDAQSPTPERPGPDEACPSRVVSPYAQPFRTRVPEMEVVPTSESEEEELRLPRPAVELVDAEDEDEVRGALDVADDTIFSPF